MSAGFTLVELLVAMLAGSFLLASLSYVTASMGRELRSTPGEQDLAAIADAAATLTSLIERAQPPLTDALTFSGDSQALSLVVPPPAILGPVGPVRLDLTAERQADGAALLARFNPLSGGTPLPAPSRRPVTLLRGLGDIRFDYDEPGHKERPQLPRLISITLTSRDKTVRTIAIVPRINSDGACRFDPISLTCRA